LYDQMGDVAKRAVGLNGLTIGVYVPDLHDRGANNECATEEAKRRPERRTCSLIEAAS
jgi:hypothetical protein